jgi:hypothetical protein
LQGFTGRSPEERRAQGVHAAHRQAVGGVWLVEAVLALVVWEERLISRRTQPECAVKREVDRGL